MADRRPPLLWQSGSKLVLASASPQRAEILRSHGVTVDVRPSAVVELQEGDPAGVALANARAKAQAGRAALSSAEATTHVVLGADTLVALGSQIYGKPVDQQQARQFLTELSSAPHEVIGAIVVIDSDGVSREAVTHTDVEFRDLTAAEIDSQVSLGEWEGRAGGYAIQLSGDDLVARIGPDRLNVVGLSIVALNGLVQGLLPSGGA